MLYFLIPGISLDFYYAGIEIEGPAHLQFQKLGTIHDQVVEARTLLGTSAAIFTSGQIAVWGEIGRRGIGNGRQNIGSRLRSVGVAFNFNEGFHVVSATQGGAYLRDFDDDFLDLVDDEKVLRVFGAIGVEMLLTTRSLLVRGACDQAFCSIDMSGMPINYPVAEFQPVLLPFPPTEILDISLTQETTLFLLRNGSLFAMGSSAAQRLCLAGEEVYNSPVHILDRIQYAVAGEQFLAFVTEDRPDKLYVCGRFCAKNQIRPELRRADIFQSSNTLKAELEIEAYYQQKREETLRAVGKPLRELANTWGPGLTITQIAVAPHAVFAVVDSQLYAAGCTTEETFAGEDVEEELLQEIYLGIQVSGVAAGPGGSLVYGASEEETLPWKPGDFGRKWETEIPEEE